MCVCLVGMRSENQLYNWFASKCDKHCERKSQSFHLLRQPNTQSCIFTAFTSNNQTQPEY